MGCYQGFSKCSLYLLQAILIWFSVSSAGHAWASMGPRTEPVPFDQYAEVRYVSIVVGSDFFGDGSMGYPWYSVVHALSEITDATAGHRYALVVARGTYGSFTVDMKPWVDLYGGFEEIAWARDVVINETILDGEQQRQVVNGAEHARIDGFRITGGSGETAGGVRCYDCSPVISNNVIAGNRASSKISSTYPGGGLELVNGAAVVMNCLIFGNHCTASLPSYCKGGGGVAIHHYSSAFLADCAIYSNSTGLEGAGGVLCMGSTPLVCNCVIHGNTSASEMGSGFFSYPLNSQNSDPTIANTILWGNKLSEIFPGPSQPLTVIYSDIQGGYPGERNLNKDPLFLDPTSGDFHIQSDSPCIGKGVGPAIYDKVPLLDFDGDPRSGETCDIGADEFVGEIPVNTETPTLTQTLDPTPTPTVTPTPTASMTETPLVTPTVTPTIDPLLLDDDHDGVPNVVESAAPGEGDGNKDGIPDSSQKYVASLPNARDGRYVTLVCVPPSASLAHVRAATSTGGDAPPSHLPFPLGFFAFEMTGFPADSGAGILMLLPGEFDWSSYMKFGPTPEVENPNWYSFTFDGSTGLLSNGGNALLLWFKDGARGDDDLIPNGIIRDIGGPVGIETGIARWRAY